MSYRNSPRQVSISEIFGLVIGGAALIGVLSAQALFVAWVI